MVYEEILSRKDALLSEIANTARQGAHGAKSPILLAVVKQQPKEKIHILLESGHRFFAENRVNEGNEHWRNIIEDYPMLELHMIGALQSNKAEQAVLLFDVIETLDRVSLLNAIQKAAQKEGKVQRCYIQVNIGEEDQKSGVLPSELEVFFQQCLLMPNIIVEGLMCIPPADKPAAPYFALMKKYQEYFQLKSLSMGMSGDFAEALRFGATHVRIGTKLMGERLPRK